MHWLLNWTKDFLLLDNYYHPAVIMWRFESFGAKCLGKLSINEVQSSSTQVFPAKDKKIVQQYQIVIFWVTSGVGKYFFWKGSLLMESYKGDFVFGKLTFHIFCKFWCFPLYRDLNKHSLVLHWNFTPLHPYVLHFSWKKPTAPSAAELIQVSSYLTRSTVTDVAWGRLKSVILLSRK